MNDQQQSSQIKSVRLIVLNYNGKSLLEKHLPSVVRAAEKSQHKCVVSVIDNVSQDDSVDYLKTQFPDVHLYEAKENRVLCSFNDLAKESTEDILLLLNNDLTVGEDFVDPMIDLFLKDDNVCFVSTYGDCGVADFHWGCLDAKISDERRENNQVAFTLNTGMGAFDRKKFLELEGYDELYLPGRYEDVDLCYRAWKRGYIGYYQPHSKVIHEGQTSFNKRFTEKEIDQLVYRNSIIFMIKNITDKWMLFRFTLFQILRLPFFLLTGRFFMIAGFREATQMLPKILSKRKKVASQFTLSDHEVIRKVNHA